MNAPPLLREASPKFAGIRRLLGRTRPTWPVLPLFAAAALIVVFDIESGISMVSLVVPLIAGLPIVVPRLIAGGVRLACGPARRDLASDLIEALLVACGWVAALSIAATIFHTLARRLPEKLGGSWLAAGAWPIAILSALVGFGVFATLVLRAANVIARWRLSGTPRTRAAIDAFTTWIAWSIVAILYLSLVHVTKHQTVGVFLIAIGFIGAYALVIGLVSLSSLAPASADRSHLWILLPREIPDAKRLAKIAHSLTKLWKHGAVTWVIPEGVAIRGVHAYLADRAGEMAALHPRQPHELEDWLRAVPADANWRALPLREVHPSEDMRHAVVRRHATVADCVVVLTADHDELLEWMRALPGYNLGAAWLANGGFPPWLDVPHTLLYGSRGQQRRSDLSLLVRLFAGTRRVARKVVLLVGPQIEVDERQKTGMSASLDKSFEILGATLTQLNLGAGDLAITQGASGIEILFLELCQVRQIPVVLIQPQDELGFVQRFVTSGGDAWRLRYVSAVSNIPAGRITHVLMNRPSSAHSRYSDVWPEITKFVNGVNADETHVILVKGNGALERNADTSHLMTGLPGSRGFVHVIEMPRSSIAA